MSFLDELPDLESPDDDTPLAVHPGEPCDGCGRTDWVACLVVVFQGKQARVCAGCAAGAG